MTISPPAKVKIEDIKPFDVLHFGFDSLDLAIDVNWRSNGFFELLEEWKAAAQEIKEEVPRFLSIDLRHKRGSWPIQKGCIRQQDLRNPIGPFHQNHGGQK